MSKFLRRMSAKWQSYRYRFVPWVALNLKERTVRSVKDASQDRIIADHLVEETYRKLFTALEDNLPDQEGGVHEWHELNTERNRLNRSKVSPVARRSGNQDDDGSIRCYHHHDNVTQESCNEQSSLEKLLFQRTCGLFCGQKSNSTWTSCRESGAVCNVDESQERYQQSLARRLLQFLNFGINKLFEVSSMDADCRGAFETNQVLIRNQTNASSTHTNSRGSYSHHQCCNPALSLHRPLHRAPSPPPPRHQHHHHSYCHHSCYQYQNSKRFLKQKHNLRSVQIGHQRGRSTSNNVKHSTGNTSEEEEVMGSALDPGETIMHQTLGYAIGRRQSQIKGGGIGVQVTKGAVPKGVVVAMYPGTIYYPAEPIFFQSIVNPFIFRCLDGIHIDGNDKRLSKMIFRSCTQRDRLGPYMFSDLSWLTSCPLNPMAVGQYVNNQHKGVPANVCYQEFDVPLDFPMKLRKYIPNTFFGTLSDVGNSGRYMRTVALVSVREIQCGEELLSSYFTLVY